MKNAKLNIDAYAIIMAGGNGERFWPVSTADRPKQFVDLFGGKPLIRHAVDRLGGLFKPDRIFVITSDRFVKLTRDVLPMLPAENIVGEPCRRDTAAAVATACGLVLRRGGSNAVGCILTADQLIKPADVFCKTLLDAIKVAHESNAIVTMGVVPTRPDTGFGYIETSKKFSGCKSKTRTVFREVKHFVEKPNLERAQQYLDAGNFLWNAGMFVWKASTMSAEFHRSAPDIAVLIDDVAASKSPKKVIDGLYPDMRAISVDFAVMEKASRILVAESRFDWDDVGSWTALEHNFQQDGDRNTVLGKVNLQNVKNSVTVNITDDGHVLAIAGLNDVVVVHTPKGTLVCSKAELANLKKLVKTLN